MASPPPRPRSRWRTCWPRSPPTRALARERGPAPLRAVPFDVGGTLVRPCQPHADLLANTCRQRAVAPDGAVRVAFGDHRAARVALAYRALLSAPRGYAPWDDALPALAQFRACGLALGVIPNGEARPPALPDEAGFTPS